MTDDRSSFGRYLRNRRHGAGLSLRDLATHLEVSHVFLSKVERGQKSLPEKYWQPIVGLIPSITYSELRKYSDLGQPIQISIEDGASPDLGLALARRLSDKQLSNDELEKLMKLLGW